MPRVLVLTSYDHVVSHGIAHMLRKESSIDLVQRVVNNELLLQKMIEELAPNSVVLDQKLFIRHAALILTSIRQMPEMKVLVLDERENVIHVLQEKKVPIHSEKDLINEILSVVVRDVRSIES